MLKTDITLLMKRSIVKTFTMLFASSMLFCLCAEAEQFLILSQDVSSEKMLIAQDVNMCAFQGTFQNDTIIGSSWFGGSRHSDLKFSTTLYSGSCVIYERPFLKEGVVFGIAGNNTHYNLPGNPYFEPRNVSQVSFLLSAYSQRFFCWQWQVQVAVTCDPRHLFYVGYNYYDFLVWGRYDWREDVNFHVGFAAQSGLDIDRFYPVVGMDWQANEKLTFSCVFPLNMSIKYMITDSCFTTLAARFLNTRCRLGTKELLPEAVLEYRNFGIEWGIRYQTIKMLADVHVGITVKGQLNVYDTLAYKKKSYSPPSNLYVGGQFVVVF